MVVKATFGVLIKLPLLPSKVMFSKVLFEKALLTTLLTTAICVVAGVPTEYI